MESFSDYSPSSPLRGGVTESHSLLLSRKQLIVIVAVIIGLSLFALAASVTIVVLVVHNYDDSGSEVQRHGVKNMIFGITDGCGPASITFAREMEGRNLTLDSILRGSSRTYSSDSLVTDSAAGATAYSCGQKSYNGAIAVDDNKKPLGTVLEAAQRKGMKTGLVVTSRITHATPASFASHAIDRNMEAFIAKQEIDLKVDVLFGGGLSFFVNRTDGIDLLDYAVSKGYTVILTLAEFEKYEGTGPVLALFSDSHMNYEIDRDPAKQPSLAQMVTKALSILNKDNHNGFYLMVEGSRIDHAGHDNDPAAHYHDIIAYDNAIKEIIKFIKADQNTLFVGSSDHETGGMTLGVGPRGGGSPVYQWYPNVVKAVKASVEVMLNKYILTDGQDPVDVLKTYAGIDVTPVERGLIDAARNSSAYVFHHTLTEIISFHSGIGWTTWGHTGVDVNVYAYSTKDELVDKFRGNNENIDIGKMIMSIMGVDVGAVTKDIEDFVPYPTTTTTSISRSSQEIYGLHG